MHTLIIHAETKPEQTEAFIVALATFLNEHAHPAGLERFQISRDDSQPTHISLVEEWPSSEALTTFLETPSFAAFRDQMMAEWLTAAPTARLQRIVAGGE